MSPNAGGGELRGLSQWVQLYTGAQINFGDLTPYLTYAETEAFQVVHICKKQYFNQVNKKLKNLAIVA
jgi:hypothetical protein